MRRASRSARRPDRRPARRDRLTGTGGADRLYGRGGDDVLTACAGDDLLAGDAGRDRLRGGPGQRHARSAAAARPHRGRRRARRRGGGGGQRQRRRARRRRDRVACGPGRDTVRADARDDIEGDCETVEQVTADADGRPVVLLVDDDAAIRRSVAEGLELEGFEVVPASGGRAALAALESVEPAVVAARPRDARPRRARGAARGCASAATTCPVCVLSARDEVGRPRARPGGRRRRLRRQAVRARGGRRAAARAAAPPPARAGRAARGRRPRARPRDPARPRRGGRDLELTRRELDLLALFLRRPGEILSRREMHEEVWGYTFDPGTNVADVFVGYLRRKLEAGGEPRVLHTVRGVGFVLRP